MTEQLPLGGLPPLPPKRPRGRPTKTAAAKHAETLGKALLPTRAQAIKRAEEGMARATDKADRTAGGWSERACAMVLEYGEIAGSGGFLIEHVRAYATGKGFEAPPNARAWGSIPLALSRQGKIESCGVGRAVSSNNTFKVRWRLVKK